MPQTEKSRVALELVSILKKCSTHLGNELRDMTDAIGYLGKGNIRVAKELFDVLSNEKANRGALHWTADAIGEVRVREIVPNLRFLLWEDHIQGNLDKKVREAIDDLEFPEISNRLFNGIIYNKEEKWNYINDVKNRSNEVTNKNKSAIVQNLSGRGPIYCTCYAIYYTIYGRRYLNP